MPTNELLAEISDPLSSLLTSQGYHELLVALVEGLNAGVAIEDVQETLEFLTVSALALCLVQAPLP